MHNPNATALKCFPDFLINETKRNEKKTPTEILHICILIVAWCLLVIVRVPFYQQWYFMLCNNVMACDVCVCARFFRMCFSSSFFFSIQFTSVYEWMCLKWSDYVCVCFALTEIDVTVWTLCVLNIGSNGCCFFFFYLVFSRFCVRHFYTMFSLSFVVSLCVCARERTTVCVCMA